MIEKELKVYLVTITNGDEIKPTGTEIIVYREEEAKSILKNGYYVYSSKIGTDGGHNNYPCTIKELTYKFDKVQNYGRSFNDKIEKHYDKPEYDWRDHWC